MTGPKNTSDNEDQFIDKDAEAKIEAHPEDQFIDDKGKSALKKYISQGEPMGKIEAGLAGVGQGAGFGFTPRISALAGALGEAGQNLIGQGPSSAADKKLADLGITSYTNPQGQQVPLKQSVGDLYNDYLKAQNAYQQKASTDQPMTYKGSEFAGMLASPANKLATVGALGKAPEGASMLSKMYHGAAGGAKIGAAAGLSQSSDLVDVPQDINKMGQGAAGGMAIGAALPPVFAGTGKLAKASAGIGKTVFGPVAEMAKKGWQAPAEGGPQLATEEGQKEGLKNVGNWATDTVKNWMDILESNAKDKRTLIQNATQDVPKEQVDAVLQSTLEANPKLNTPEAKAELARLKEMILTAKEGSLQKQTIRQYVPGMGPKPISSLPQEEHLDSTQSMLPQTEDLAPEDATQSLSGTATPTNQLISSESVAQPAEPTMTSEMTPQEPTKELMNEPEEGEKLPAAIEDKAEQGHADKMEPDAESPQGFAGYEAVHRATIEAGDQEAMQAFKQKVHEKLIDEQALGKNSNPNNIQIDAHPVPGTNQIRLLAKRAVSDEDPNAFMDQAQDLADQQKSNADMSDQVQQQNAQAQDEGFKQQANDLSDQQKEQQRLQKLLSQQQDEAAKQKQQIESDMLKQPYQDIQVEARPGDRNINNPEQLYNLQQLMKGMSQFREGRGFSSDEMTKMAGNLSTDLSKIIKDSVGTSTVDDKIHAINNIGEALGIDLSDLSTPGGAGQEAQTNAINKLLKLVEPQNLSDKTILNQNKLQYIYQQLQEIHPDLANQFLKNAAQQADTKGLIKEFSRPYEPSGINWLFNAIRKNASKASYSAGYGASEQAQRIGKEMAPAVQAGQRIFNQFAPDALQQAASKAASSGDAQLQQFGEVLNKMSTMDERSRNAFLFTLQQQTPYRNMMDKLLPQKEEKTPTARNKNLTGTSQ